VKIAKNIRQSFIVDSLTNSIRNTISSDSFETEVSKFTKLDSKQTIKKNGWGFNWSIELNDLKKEVYKLTIVNNIDVVQGLISITYEADHIFMNLVESAPFNIGKNKLYEGVPGNLVAYACKLSFQKGFDGFVGFTAKTKLIQHYEETLGAYHFGGHRMIISTKPAKFLVDKYFKS
jgi:hypothetical protein